MNRFVKMYSKKWIYFSLVLRTSKTSSSRRHIQHTSREKLMQFIEVLIFFFCEPIWLFWYGSIDPIKSRTNPNLDPNPQH
jgi:hypothetical protein